MTEADPSAIPSESPVPDETVRQRSQIIVYTGDGKGKSSSAFGVMTRAVARDWSVAVIQFLKSGDWNVGEEKVGRQLGVDWWAIGEGFTWDSEDLAQDQAEALEAWRHAKATIEAGAHELVIIDEITYPINWGWIELDDVVTTFTNRPASVNIVATGRDAPAGLLDIADIATEMRKIKHSFDRGVLARKGLDY